LPLLHLPTEVTQSFGGPHVHVLVFSYISSRTVGETLRQRNSRGEEEICKGDDRSEEFGDLEEQELEARAEVATEVLTKVIHYEGKTRDQASELDHAVKMLFHWMGMGKTLKTKQISDGLTVQVAGELARVAKKWKPNSLLLILDYGRRFGETKLTSCEYVVFTHTEMRQLRDDVAELIANPDVPWTHPDFPIAASRDLVVPLEKHLRDKSLGFYGNFT
jgi:hypothetical protein